MLKLISIDPGKYKCGLVLAEISEKKVYEAIILKSELIDPLKLKSNGWSQHAEILATAVNKSKIFYEVPISYSGRTFEEGKKIKARHTFSVIYMIIKKRLF